MLYLCCMQLRLFRYPCEPGNLWCLLRKPVSTMPREQQTPRWRQAPFICLACRHIATGKPVYLNSVVSTPAFLSIASSDKTTHFQVHLKSPSTKNFSNKKKKKKQTRIKYPRVITMPENMLNPAPPYYSLHR